MIEGNPAGGGFGRRRDPLMGVPAAAPPVARPSSSSSSDEPYAREVEASSVTRISWLQLAGYLPLLLLVIITLEATISNTSVITPVNATFLQIMRGIGFVTGIILAALIIIRPHVPMGILKKLLLFLFTPFLIGFAAGEAAWRITDWIEFGFSTAPFTEANYPITGADHGRRGRRDSVKIDPFGLGIGTGIAIPAAQFDAIWLHHDDYCITVLQRRSASGAVQILNDGVFTLDEPKSAILTRCRPRGSKP